MIQHSTCSLHHGRHSWLASFEVFTADRCVFHSTTSSTGTPTQMRFGAQGSDNILKEGYKRRRRSCIRGWLTLSRTRFCTTFPFASGLAAPPELGVLVLNSRLALRVHGPAQQNAANIIQQGFAERLTQRELYGRGVYFATDACKAEHRFYIFCNLTAHLNTGSGIMVVLSMQYLTGAPGSWRPLAPLRGGVLPVAAILWPPLRQAWMIAFAACLRAYGRPDVRERA